MSHSNSKYFPILHNTDCEVLRSIAKYCEVLRSIAKYCEVLRSIAKYLQIIAKYCKGIAKYLQSMKMLQNKTFLITFKRCAVKYTWVPLDSLQYSRCTSTYITKYYK